MKLAFKIAVRFLKSAKTQTVLIVLGIAVGVSVQIFIGSLIQGLQKTLVEKTIGNTAQIVIQSDKQDKTIDHYNEILKELSGLKNGVINLSAVADNPALIVEENKNYSVLVRGMVLNDSDKIYQIKERIYEGKEPIKDNEVILGRDLKEQLGIKLKDTIGLLTNTGKQHKVIVTGFYDLKVAAINKSWVITTINTAQNLFALGDKVTGIEMQVNQVFQADSIAQQIAAELHNNLIVEDWKSQNSELLSGLNGQSVSSYMIQVFVLLAVVLGIASVLAITVIQKSKQIGILKAMGIIDRVASLIFLFEGFILGCMGAILGVSLGLFLGFMFTKFALNPDGTPVVELYINYAFIGFSAVIALLSATIASLIPARHSSKLNPIEVIKNG